MVAVDVAPRRLVVDIRTEPGDGWKRLAVFLAVVGCCLALAATGLFLFGVGETAPSGRGPPALPP